MAEWSLDFEWGRIAFHHHPEGRCIDHQFGLKEAIICCPNGP
jgi:hypothetical protein